MFETPAQPLPTAIPTQLQLDYQDWEWGIFLHVGIRTFYEGHKDFDGKAMVPEAFLPSAFDADQWTRTAKEAGARYMVLTAKHHDGFANWPSKYTSFSVGSSPWRDGKGDVVRDYVDACRRHDLKVGLYYSPVDVACPVYDDPKAYDDYFINQISELLTGYGEISILWFDGCGSENHTYDWKRIIGEIRRMQPKLLIFNMGDPDFRWVGNEVGVAPKPCWNTVSAVPFSIQTSEADVMAEPTWLPAECDCRMRLRNWFYSDHDADTVKSLDELLGLYYLSVGRGTNFLINIGPDRRGLLPEPDTQALLALGAELRRRFGSPVATMADGVLATDGLSWTWKSAAPTQIDHAVLMEDLTAGEHVRGWILEVKPLHCRVFYEMARGESLGHKAIVPFPSLPASEVRLRLTAVDGPAALRSVTLHHTASAR